MKIIIAGAGFGGLACARKLEKISPQDWEILIIDQNQYHLYTPTLYEIATTSETTAGNIALERIVTMPLKCSLRRTRTLQVKITSFDIKNKKVLLQNQSAQNYDYLVVGLGSETNFFGIKGSQVAIPLKNLYDAIKIRDQIETIIQQYKYEIDQRAEIKIVIIGGGSAGTETAGEIAVWIKHLEKTYHKKFTYKIAIFEAGASILANFPKKVVELVRKRLLKFKIGVRESTPIKEIDPEKKQIICSTGACFSYDVLIWAAGIKAPDVLTTLGMKQEKRGRILINPKGLCLPTDEHLHLTEKVFVIGDSACLVNPVTGQPLPQVARIAIEQGKLAAENIVRSIENKDLKEFKVKTYPYVIPIGGKWAVAFYKNIIIFGFFGWIFKGLIELFYLLTILKPWQAIKIWFHGLKIFLKND